jgi:alanyl-tRNA synthetase
MIGHHVFNSPNKYVYWKEEAVAYCYNFLTKELGIPGNKIIFKEKPWFGGGNAGPSLEVICEGLELCTLVFMNLKQTEQGDIQLEDGNRYSRMNLQVVDPGWGLDRFVWMSQASTSAYEAVFGSVLENLKKEVGINPDETVLSEYSRVEE